MSDWSWMPWRRRIRIRKNTLKNGCEQAGSPSNRQGGDEQEAVLV